MKNLFKFPLHLQLFADPAGTDNTVTEPSAQGNQGLTIDYDKMAEAINKRASQTADNVLKGYLKQQGLSGEELDQAVSAYKTKKKEDDANAKQAQEDMKLENQRLKAQILNSNIDSKLSALAAAEGISMEKVPFLLKLVERDNLTDDKGEVLEDKIKEAMNVVLKAFPDFKGATQGNDSFRQVGSSGAKDPKTQVDKELDAIFGIKN